MSRPDTSDPAEEWIIPPEPETGRPAARRAGRLARPARVVAPIVAALLLGGGGVVFALDHQSGAGANAGNRPAVSGESRLDDSGESRESHESDESDESHDHLKQLVDAGLREREQRDLR